MSSLPLPKAKVADFTRLGILSQFDHRVALVSFDRYATAVTPRRGR